MADLRKFFTALAAMHESGPDAIEQLHCALERIPLTVQHLKETPMHLVHHVLTPPISDPTRRPRRTANPRLRVRSVHGLPLRVLPAADSRNLTDKLGHLWCAEWEIWLIDENGQERLVEWTDSGELALAALPKLMRDLGFLNEDDVRPATEGGVSDAA